MPLFGAQERKFKLRKPPLAEQFYGLPISPRSDEALARGDMKRTLRDAFDRWKDALIEQDKQTTRAARHRAHARVTSMQDLIAETPADDIEGVGIKLALFVYMSGVDPETTDGAVEQVLSAYKDCVRVHGWDLLAEVKSLMAVSQQAM